MLKLKVGDKVWHKDEKLNGIVFAKGNYLGADTTSIGFENGTTSVYSNFEMFYFTKLDDIFPPEKEGKYRPWMVEALGNEIDLFERFVAVFDCEESEQDFFNLVECEIACDYIPGSLVCQIESLGEGEDAQRLMHIGYEEIRESGGEYSVENHVFLACVQKFAEDLENLIPLFTEVLWHMKLNLKERHNFYSIINSRFAQFTTTDFIENCFSLDYEGLEELLGVKKGGEYDR